MGFWHSRHILSHKGEMHGGQSHHHDHETPRYASLYHSYMGYIGFFFSFLIALMALSMIAGFWQPRATVTLLSLSIIWFFGYLLASFFNARWYGNTMTTRLYWRLDILEYASFATHLPKYNTVIERDLKFHNDQWHFSKATMSYFFFIIFYAAFLGSTGNANPDPDYNSLPLVYDATLVGYYVITKFFQLFVLGISASLGFILLETHSCFIHSTLVSLNNQLVAHGVFTEGLETPKERPGQPGQTNNGGQDLSIDSRMNGSHYHNHQKHHHNSNIKSSDAYGVTLI